MEKRAVKRSYLIKVFILSITFLSACSPSATVVTFTPSLTASPEFTFTPTLTPTKTPVPTPTNTPRPAPPADALNLRKEFIGIGDPTGNGGPDATIAAGHTVLVLAMNTTVGIMDKAGNLIDVKPMEDFFAPLKASGVGVGTDPRLLYDPESQRFFLVKADYPDNPACTPTCGGLITLAVSKSDTPMTLSSEDWFFYTFDRSVQKTGTETKTTGYFGDFDNLAIMDDVLAISWDVDSHEGWLGPGGQLRVIDLLPLIHGQAPAMWQDVVGLPGHVAISLGEANRFFVVDSLPSEFQIWAVENSLTSPAVTTRKPISFNSTLNDPPDALQLDGPPLEILDGKAQSVYQNGSLWVAMVIRQDYGSGLVSSIQWMQIDVSNWPATEIIQSGILGEDGIWYFAPAIMVDNSNNFALVYTRASTNEFVSVHYTGRLATDPLSTLRPSNLLKSGDVSYARIQNGRNRFVDYFGMALDPVDSSIWLMGLYPEGSNKSGSWVGNIDWTISTGQ